MKTIFTFLFIFLVGFAWGQKVEFFVPSSSKPLYSSDSSLVLTFSNYQIQVWENYSYKLKTIINLPFKGYGIENYFDKFVPIFNPATNDIIVNTLDSNIYIFRFTDGVLLSKIKMPQLIRSISINKKGNILIASSIYNDNFKDNTNYVFNLKTNQLVWQSRDNGYPEYQFNSDGTRLLIFNSNLLNNKSYTLFKTDSLIALNDFENQVTFCKHLNLIVEPIYRNNEQFSIINFYSSINGQLVDSIQLYNKDRGFYTKNKYDYPNFYIDDFIAYYSNGLLTFYSILNNQKYSFNVNKKPEEDDIRKIISEIDTLEERTDICSFIIKKIDKARKQSSLNKYNNGFINDEFFSLDKYDRYDDSIVFRGIEIINTDTKQKVLFLPNEGKDYRQFSSSFFVTYFPDSTRTSHFNIYNAHTLKKVFSSVLKGNGYSRVLTILNDSLLLYLDSGIHRVINFLNEKEYASFISNDCYTEYYHINILQSLFSIDSLIFILNNNWVDKEIELGNYSKKYNVNYVSINNKRVVNDYNNAWFNSICKKNNIIHIHQICMTKDYSSLIHNGISENSAVSWDINNGKINFYKQNVFSDLGGPYSSSLQMAKINEFIISGPSGNHNSFIEGRSIKTGEKLYTSSYGYGISQPCYNAQDCNIYSNDSIYSLQSIYSKNYDTLYKNYLFNNVMKHSKSFVNKNGINYYGFTFFDRNDILGFYQNKTFTLMCLKNFTVLKKLNSLPTFIDTSDFYYIKNEIETGNSRKIQFIVENLSRTTYHKTYSYIDTFEQQILYKKKDSVYILLVAKDGKTLTINLNTKEVEKSTLPKNNFIDKIVCPQKDLFIGANNNQLKFYQLSTGKPLYTYIPLDENNFIVYDEEGHYDASENALQYIYYSCGNKVVPASKTNYKSRVVGLVQKIMGNQKHLITAPTKEDLNICNLVE